MDHKFKNEQINKILSDYENYNTAVESAKVIPANKSRDLAAKISSLAGNYGAACLRRNISCEGRIKTGNEKIFIIIDTVNEAINEKKRSHSSTLSIMCRKKSS